MKVIKSIIFLVVSFLLPFSALANFPDIAENHLNKPAIEYLQENKVIGGYTDGTYKPDHSINRAEFLKVVIGARFKNDLSVEYPTTLSDVESGAWFAPYVYKALSENIISGYPDGSFRPSNNINLAEALKIITLTYNVSIPQYIQTPKHWFDPYIDGANSASMLNLISSKVPSYEITRADTAALIYTVLTNASTNITLSEVVEVIDGDTVKIMIGNEVETIRLIGIDTPETVHPYKPVQCYGPEASQKAKELLEGKQVRIELDESQGEKDTYDRTLAYLFLTNGKNIAEELIAEGYGKEYTYNKPYHYIESFKKAEQEAKSTQSGLWSPNTCNGITQLDSSPVNPGVDITQECQIKGNISTSTKEKIYHLPGCSSYNQTVITESKGERWFCSEDDAVHAGWRIALNCY